MGVLLAMMNYASQFWGPINQLANIYNNFINNVAYLERIFEMIDEPVEVQDAPGARSAAGDPRRCGVPRRLFRL